MAIWLVGVLTLTALSLLAIKSESSRSNEASMQSGRTRRRVSPPALDALPRVALDGAEFLPDGSVNLIEVTIVSLTEPGLELMANGTLLRIHDNFVREVPFSLSYTSRWGPLVAPKM